MVPGLAGCFVIDRVGFTITVKLVYRKEDKEKIKLQTSPKTEDGKKHITYRARQSRQSHIVYCYK